MIGKPGRRAVQSLLPELIQQHEVDLVIANGENSAGGFGITLETAQELFQSGVNIITTGNHAWDQREIIPHLNGELPILRPYNYPSGVPGKGYLTKGRVMIVNLMGRTFMPTTIDCPFRAMDSLLSQIPNKPPVIIVDFHGEATSEKGAMGWYLNGRVSAVLGTHTHVGTIDALVLPKGTAYVTDVGMVGPRDSVIGDDPEPVIERFLTGMPKRLSVGRGQVVRFSSVLVKVDGDSGKAVEIQRIDLETE